MAAQLRVDTGNPWRPPFGLDRVGAAPVVHVELKAEGEPRRDYFVVAFRNGREIERLPVALAPNPTGGKWGKVPDGTAPWFGRALLGELPDAVELVARCAADGRMSGVMRTVVEWPAVEADALARPAQLVNPVDLGAVLVPRDWLLLAGGQRALIDVAAISRVGRFPRARLRAWFDDGRPVEADLSLGPNQRVTRTLELSPGVAAERSVLHLEISATGTELWRKDIPTMIVAKPPPFPKFGAVELKLRYDAPITVEGKIVDYRTAWNPELKDVVVFLPNGERFVFWRWFRYAPFWASRQNTAFNYEWAENLTHPFATPEWGTLYPEPLFDQQLRYSRVRIVESTASRVHVRWTYEGTDPQYRRWGEQVAEDFYFYPDGFGTRVMTLSSEPNASYEVSEFIVLMPQGAYPLEVLPEKVMEMLYVDGDKREFNLPNRDLGWKPYGNTAFILPGLRDLPAIYRVFQERNDPAAAIFFNPRHIPKTSYVYQHRYEEGEIVTPALGFRNANGPGFNSLWTAIKDLPEPNATTTRVMPDALGRAREMMIRRWAWLIAKTDAADEPLLKWAQSFSAPPALEVTGAHLDLPSFVPERRAMRLVADSAVIAIKLKTASHCVNPVFELAGAPKDIGRVTLNGRELPPADYAWDGRTLWVKAEIDQRGADITLHFQ